MRLRKLISDFNITLNLLECSGFSFWLPRVTIKIKNK